MSKLVLLAALGVVASARPNADIGTQNVVTVPPNCPPGQEWINGKCREVWRQSKTNPKNVITVPPNCPPGQQMINGHCRDVWKLQSLNLKNVVVVPPNCPASQEYINGECREVWIKRSMDLKNTVVVPPNCHEGQKYINGECRKVWIKRSVDPKNTGVVALNRQNMEFIRNGFNTNSMYPVPEFRNKLKTLLQRITRSADEAKGEIHNRNIISVPNHCPNGYEPDVLGICRPIFR